MNMHNPAISVETAPQMSPENCEAYRTGLLMEELNQTYDRLQALEFDACIGSKNHAALTSGVSASVAAADACNHVVDQAVHHKNHICEVRARSLEGALVQLICLLSRYRIEVGGELEDCECKRYQTANERLLFNLIGFMEDYIGKSSAELGIGSELPGKGPMESIPELFELARKLPMPVKRKEAAR